MCSVCSHQRDALVYVITNHPSLRPSLDLHRSYPEEGAEAEEMMVGNVEPGKRPKLDKAGSFDVSMNDVDPEQGELGPNSGRVPHLRVLLSRKRAIRFILIMYMFSYLIHL